MPRNTDPRHFHATRRENAPLRRFCATLRMHRVCDHAACRAAHACRGEGAQCWARNARRLPDLVLLWALCFCDARAQDMSFEEAMAALDATPMGPAFAEWVARADTPGRPLRRAPRRGCA